MFPESHTTMAKISTTSPDLRWFIADQHGKVFVNSQKLPLESLLEASQFAGDSKLMRFVFIPDMNVLYIQDGREWHSQISDGDEDAWKILNSALWFIRNNFNAQPNLKYGDPPGSAAARKLSQFDQAWDKIKEYVHQEFEAAAKDIPVFEYTPTEKIDVDVGFSAGGIKIGDLSSEGPTFLINLGIDIFGAPDYKKINSALVDRYLENIQSIHPSEWKTHIAGEGLYFAIWHNGTRVFRATHEQAGRLIDEDFLREEPSLNGYSGPIILFSYDPKRNRILLRDTHHEELSQGDSLKGMLADIKRKIAKSHKASDSDMVMSHDDIAGRPFLTKISRQHILWDFIQDTLSGKAGFQPEDMPIIEGPLTKDRSIKAKLVNSPEDEQDIPLELALRAKHGVPVTYPFIAVESRLPTMGAKLHEILRVYAEKYQALQSVPMIELNFQKDNVFQSKKDLSNKLDDGINLTEWMKYMLEMGMTKKSILDFFADRGNAGARGMYIMPLLKALDETRAARIERREPSQTKLASLDLGINDWQFIGLQEALNSSQHVNDKQTQPAGGIKPFNLKEKRQEQFSQGPRTMEGLLHKQHDREMNSMKSMEQLLRESQI